MERKSTRGNSKPNVFLPATADLRHVEEMKAPAAASPKTAAASGPQPAKPVPAPAPAGLRPAQAAMATLRASKPPATAGLRQAAPTHDQISARAKEIWQASGCKPGRDKENWVEAEAQLRKEMCKPPACRGL